MSRVMEAWEQVLRDAVSSDYDEKQYALLQIGMVLQRHNPHLSLESDAEEETLSRELLRLSLNHQRQADTIEYLTTLVRKHTKDAGTLFYALGNAQPVLLAEPLIKLLNDIGPKLNADARYQALLALDGVLKHNTPELRDVLARYDLVPLLDDWAGLEDDLVADKADILADRIIEFVDGANEGDT